MEDKIRDKVIHAYDGIVLEEKLKRQAEKTLFEKAKKGSRTRYIYGVAVAAAVVILVFVNIMLIRFNLGHGEHLPVTGTTSNVSKEETIRNIQMKELDEVQTPEELKALADSSNAYVLELESNFYIAVLCYGQNGEPCLPSDNMTTKIKHTYFWFNDTSEKPEKMYGVERTGDKWKSLGAVFINDDWYEVWDSSKEGADHYYEIFNITSPHKSSYARHPEDGETTEYIRSNATFFARLAAEDGALYWQVGDNIESGTDYSSKSFCEKYSWDEQCTKDMTMRDIYVAENWIGKKVSQFNGLERFFKEAVQKESVTGDLSGAGSTGNAYQTDYYFECAGFRVSAELGSDEIISVALITEHDYVTENVWIGMDMEQVRKNMGMNEEAYFEYGGNMFAAVERDGLLYEFQFQKEKIGENLPPYASYPAPDYVLTYAKISDAAKIKTSSVKSMGEHLFGDGHSLEEGKDI